MLAGRYAGNSTVIGCDLFNEVHAGATHPGPFWSVDGADEPYNWRTAAKRAGEVILSVNPDWKTPWPEKLALIAPVRYAAPDANSSTSQGGCSTAPTHRVAASAVVAWFRGAARVRTGE